MENNLEALALYSAMHGSDLYAQSAREANETNRQLADDARVHSAQQADKQMRFQYEMSSTAHQREIADLIQAGLNPILTATGGSGSPMAQGAMGSSAQAHAENTLQKNPLENLPQNTLAARRFKELELEALKSNINLQNQNIQTLQTQSAKNLADASLSQSGIGLNSAREANLVLEGLGLGYDNLQKQSNTKPLSNNIASSIFGWLNQLKAPAETISKFLK